MHCSFMLQGWVVGWILHSHHTMHAVGCLVLFVFKS
jgi:hypothetical protein